MSPQDDPDGTSLRGGDADAAAADETKLCVPGRLCATSGICQLAGRRIGADRTAEDQCSRGRHTQREWYQDENRRPAFHPAEILSASGAHCQWAGFTSAASRFDQLVKPAFVSRR